MTSKGACEASEGATYDSVRQNVIPHITQIAAVEHETGSQFSCYVVPKALISSGAEDITGIVWDGTNLRLKGKVVAALQIFEGTDKSKLFNLYLESCVGCIDSIAVMKSKFLKLPKYSQPYLAEHVCNKNYNAHNALDDVSMLNEILKEAKVSSVYLLKHIYSPGDHLLQENFNKNKLRNLPSLHFLIGQGVVKMTTAENISGSGINFDH
ncbi:unnamed protein product [Mytilus coruscus]|uniref:Exonuclease domain-containing protein n=1 Tax=Mytilus coruscus TaxID=42192 RepID=A0A6J8D9R6_MYTCO|nr:unnamed protein product [Mytilus coruscus]